MARPEIPGNPERDRPRIRPREAPRELPRQAPRELPAPGGRPLPARRRGEEAAARIHPPGELPLEDVPTREECWDMLGSDVRARLQARAGTILEWWARLDRTGRPRAVVLGPNGLCKANPVSLHGRETHVVAPLRLDPRAMRRQSFTGRQSSDTGGQSFDATGTPPAARATGGARPVPTIDLGLDADTTAVLGNFPPAVQDFLQRPFLHGDSRGVVSDWDYQEATEFTHRRLSLLFVLSADRNVTFASGVRILPRGHSPEHAHWEVECYHAPVRG
ncbi:hypothetical protein [Streptomyces sp. B8F3]|uniref:hypothetical protein n=1 Tax=unclassified Streptomyces TaxID=2593676 RepID=UPI00325C9EF3